MRFVFTEINKCQAELQVIGESWRPSRATAGPIKRGFNNKTSIRNGPGLGPHSYFCKRTRDRSWPGFCWWINTTDLYHSGLWKARQDCKRDNVRGKQDENKYSQRDTASRSQLEMMISHISVHQRSYRPGVSNPAPEGLLSYRVQFQT